MTSLKFQLDIYTEMITSLKYIRKHSPKNLRFYKNTEAFSNQSCNEIKAPHIVWDDDRHTD